MRRVFQDVEIVATLFVVFRVTLPCWKERLVDAVPERERAVAAPSAAAIREVDRRPIRVLDGALNT